MMRILIITSLIAISLSFCVGMGAGDLYAENSQAQPQNGVIVYYFHNNFRCANCHNMEKWIKEVFNNDFVEDAKTGKLSLYIINTETKGNEHYMTDYKLYTKSVVLALVKDGKEVKFTNLAKIWDYLSDGGKFKTYIKDETSKYLKEL